MWYFSWGEGECPLECALSREACADREELCLAPELEDLLLRSPVVLLCMLSGSDAGAAAHQAGPPDGRAVAATQPLTDPSPLGNREALTEGSLRPKRFEDFVGQTRVIENLKVALEAARVREEPPDHVLLSGPPGLGKTTLARILSTELGTHLHTTSGPALDRPRDLVGILSNLQRGDVLFVDEIHRVPISVEEYLYSAMEDLSIDLTVNDGPAARIVQLRLEPFTLVGATTREGLLSAPFRARFGLLERFEPYPPEDLETIVLRSAGVLGMQLEPAAAAEIARRSRGTPRVANRLLARVRDLAQVERVELVPAALVCACMDRLGVDAEGLEEIDRQLLRYLARDPVTPVGLKTLAAALGESEDTIEEVLEPHLLREGLLHKTARGRQITPAGCQAVGRSGSASAGGELFS